LDKKGIAIFLGITIGVSWTVEGTLSVLPWTRTAREYQTSFILVALLLIPAFAALIASIVCGDNEHPKLTIWPIPKYPALAMAVLAPLLFGVAYSATTLAKRSWPDWKLQGLHLSQYTVDPIFFLVAGFALSIVLGPTLYAAVCAGTEFGWRAYLLPKLLPLGRGPAHLLVGFFTTVWAFPMVSDPFHYPKDAPKEFLALLAITSVVTVFLNELWLRTRHAGLTAVAAGCFLSQAVGMWQYLFPSADLPYAGTRGAASVLVWFVAAVVISRFPMPRSNEKVAEVQIPESSSIPSE
jgi:hypothetical protein